MKNFLYKIYLNEKINNEIKPINSTSVNASYIIH